MRSTSNLNVQLLVVMFVFEMFLRRASKIISSVQKIVTRSLYLGEKKLVLREKFKSLGEGNVLLERLDYRGHGIAVISLDNVKSRNAMSGKMMVKFAEIVDELEDWKDGKAVILTGVAKTFCSGADLIVARSILTPKEGEMMSSLMHDTVLRLKQLPLVSVAAVQGQALGGGAEASKFMAYWRSGYTMSIIKIHNFSDTHKNLTREVSKGCHCKKKLVTNRYQILNKLGQPVQTVVGTSQNIEGVKVVNFPVTPDFVVSDFTAQIHEKLRQFCTVTRH